MVDVHVLDVVRCYVDVMRNVHGWYKTHIIALCTFINLTEGMVGTKHTSYKALCTGLWALLFLRDEA